ncbi:hypothetical protein FH972_021297 [Carpinus fangiana]|uniref:Zn(2)-C6 fungal-type domain-containing protein n=1 Tax=Carpinus fangiana TaxID=176857 RepID=A0A5N6KPA9_9ROSI|nr:hypothetical protein FH972_021297 [Carpinus fangiana]
MAQPLHPLPESYLEHSPDSHCWGSADGPYPQEMHIPGGFNGPAFDPTSNDTASAYTAASQGALVPVDDSQVPYSTMQYSAHAAADDAMSVRRHAAWVMSQHQPQVPSQHNQDHEQQQQQYLQGMPINSSADQHFATPSTMVMPQQQHSHLPAQHRHADQLRSSNVYAGMGEPQMMYNLQPMHFSMGPSQAVLNHITADQMYRLHTTSPQHTSQALNTSPQSYHASLDGGFSASTPQDPPLQDYAFYPSHEQSVSQSFVPATFDMLQTSSATLRADGLSPSSTLSSSVMGDTFMPHTPDSLMSFTGAFENTAISNPGMALHNRNGSYNSHQSGLSISSASPHDIWQQPSSSPEIRQLDEPDDIVAYNQSHTSSVNSDETHSHTESRGTSIDGSTWPRSPELARTVVPATAHNRRRSSNVPTTAGKVLQKTIVKKPSVKKDVQAARVLAEKLDSKRIGRRKGPLTSDQRRQAGEIRKLKACIRCKFLKKTCDPNGPCAGCKPSHARLWMVPCTRLDIRELHYFMDDWKVDYDRHMNKGITVSNIIDYSPREQQIFIGHGFGDFISISAREVYVRDDKIFRVDWVETIGEKPDTVDGVVTDRPFPLPKDPASHVAKRSEVLRYVQPDAACHFDSFYRMDIPENAMKFCHEMESVPVGVITGLFSAISQRMPALRDWNTAQHGAMFSGHEFHQELCETVEKTREVMLTHEPWRSEVSASKTGRRVTCASQACGALEEIIVNERCSVVATCMPESAGGDHREEASAPGWPADVPLAGKGGG